MISGLHGPQQADAVIIGAGPVGLWTAIQLKELQPERVIHVLERFEQYERSQTLRIELTALDNEAIKNRIIKLIEKGEISYYIDKSMPDVQSFSEQKDTVEIPIQILERCLEEYAAEKGIIIKRNIKLSAHSDDPEDKEENTITPQELTQSYPQCKVFIGADGAHSSTRKLVFGNDEKMLNVEEMQYLVEFKYTTTATAISKKLNYSRHAYATEKLAGFRCDETIKVDKDSNEAKISLKFIVDKSTYETIGTASYKKPLTSLDRLPLQLKRAISVWMNAREKITQEKYHAGSGKLNKITLSAYHSKQYAKIEDAHSWFLVGDAAIGVPYFAALKCGLRCGSKLAKLLSTNVAQANDPAAVIADYDHHMQTQYKHVSKVAKEKNLGLEAWKLFVKTSAAVPWQINRWWSADLRKIQRAHPIFAAELKNIEEQFAKSIADVESSIEKNEPNAAAKDALATALKNLRQKTIEEYKSGNAPLDQAIYKATTISAAAVTLAASVADNSLNEDKIKAFHRTTAAFRTTWNWRMALGAVIGAAIGLIAGAMIGVIAGPAVAFTALCVGVQGAVIGASFFGAGGAVLGVGIGRWRSQKQDFLAKTADAARMVC